MVLYMKTPPVVLLGGVVLEQKFNDNLPGVSFRMNTIDIITRKSFVFEETGYERDFDNQIVVKSIIEL